MPLIPQISRTFSTPSVLPSHHKEFPQTLDCFSGFVWHGLIQKQAVFVTSFSVKSTALQEQPEVAGRGIEPRSDNLMRIVG